jgi:hypothetical protein
LCAFTRIPAERRAWPPVFLFDELVGGGGGARSGMGSVRQAGDRNIMGMALGRAIAPHFDAELVDGERLPSKRLLPMIEFIIDVFAAIEPTDDDQIESILGEPDKEIA